jgi:drug/metabolite transporter (DMT)-like permease
MGSTATALKTTQPRGAYFALAAAALFGVSAPLAKVLLASIPPQMLAGLLYLGSGIGLAIYRGIRRGRVEAPLRGADFGWLGIATALGGGLGPLLLMAGLTHMAASGASLLLNLEGVFTALLAWFVFRENYDRRIALGMAAIVAGSAMLTWQGEAAWGGVLGPLLIAGACLCWAMDNNLTQKVSGGDPVQVAMLKGTVAGVVNTSIALGRGAHVPAPLPAAGALLVGLFSYGISLVLYVRALRQLGSARTGAYFSTAPFVGAAASLIVFHERPTGGFIMAATLMCVGVWLHLSERHEHVHAHKAMDHQHAHVHDAHHQHEHAPDDPPATDPKPHTHRHRHEPLTHSHAHYPDLHHRHAHD